MTLPKLKYTVRNKNDASVLSFLISVRANTVLLFIYGLKAADQIWSFLANRFASPSMACINYLWCQLQLLQQGYYSLLSTFWRLRLGLPNWMLLVSMSLRMRSSIFLLVVLILLLLTSFSHKTLLLRILPCLMLILNFSFSHMNMFTLAKIKVSILLSSGYYLPTTTSPTTPVPLRNSSKNKFNNS